MLDDDDDSDEEARERRKQVGARPKVGLLRERGVISVRGKWGGSSPSRLLAFDAFHHLSFTYSFTLISRDNIPQLAVLRATGQDSSLHTQRTQRTRPHQNTLDMTQSTQSILPSSFMAHSTCRKRLLQQCVLSSSACFASLAFPASLSQDVSLSAYILVTTLSASRRSSLGEK